MEDFIILIFGLIATIVAIGPLAVALILDVRSKEDE
jgi:hypothetical protein